MFSFTNGSYLDLRRPVRRLGVSLSFCLFMAASFSALVHEGFLTWPEPELAQPAPVVVDVDLPRKVAITEYLADKYDRDPVNVRTYVDLAWAESKKNPALSPELILAVIQKESSLREDAQSRYGAQGLMQVVPRWHREKLHEAESLFTAQVNIRVGAEILQKYVSEMNGDMGRALKKYSGNARGYADFVLREARAMKDI